MEETTVDARVIAVEFAVRAIEEDDARLIEWLGGYDVHTLPPRDQRASHLLDCERNGAHVHLERLADAVKRLPRGEIPPTLLDRLQASSCDLLICIEELFQDPAVSAAVMKAENTEERCVNYLKGVSGAGEDLTPVQHRERIDVFLGDLKSDFRELLAALAAFERRLPTPEVGTSKPTRKVPRRKPHVETDSVVLKRRDDTQRVLAEIKRLHQTKGMSYSVAIQTMRGNAVWAVRMRHRSDASWKTACMPSRRRQ